jgi:hypothetical protein
VNSVRNNGPELIEPIASGQVAPLAASGAAVGRAAGAGATLLGDTGHDDTGVLF